MKQMDTKDWLRRPMIPRNTARYRLHQSVKIESGGHDKISIVEAVKKYELTNRTAISNKLVISVNTLKKHILHIYRKLGINNRVQMFKMKREQV